MIRPLGVGAVMYDPKVSVIWEIISDFFEAAGCPIDVTFYGTYEQQVDGLAEGTVDIAWNSPLAWLHSQRVSGGTCRALAMRDTDRDRVSHIVARRDGPVRSIANLRNRTLATGAADSPQATLIPVGLLRQAGLMPGGDVAIRRFDVLVGKHGDHIGGELDAFRSVQAGHADACAMLDLNWENWHRDGTIDPGEFWVVGSTPLFDHCVFTARAGLSAAAAERWLETLYSMRYENPAHRTMMDMEGLKAWLPGRTTGFAALSAAVEAEGFFNRIAR